VPDRRFWHADAVGRAQRVQTALSLPDGYLDADSGSMAIAAAALVAADDRVRAHAR